MELTKDANNKFNNLRKCINGEVAGNIDELARSYHLARNLVAKEVCSKGHEKLKTLTADTNSKRLWEKIDWKGNIKRQVEKSPLIEDLSVYFQDLYSDKRNDISKLNQLQTESNVPNLDDPIT